jgi:hypothetical protein
MSGFPPLEDGAGRGGLVATARNDLVNFGFQEAWKISGAFFQGMEKAI